MEFLLEFNSTLTVGIPTVDDTGKVIEETFSLGSETNIIQQLCFQIENAVKIQGVPMSDSNLRLSFSLILDGIPERGPSQAAIDELIECLLEHGIIAHRDFTPSPSDSISATGLDGINIQCTGDPLCAKI